MSFINIHEIIGRLLLCHSNAKEREADIPSHSLILILKALCTPCSAGSSQHHRYLHIHPWGVRIKRSLRAKRIYLVPLCIFIVYPPSLSSSNFVFVCASLQKRKYCMEKFLRTHVTTVKFSDLSRDVCARGVVDVAVVFA